METVTTSRVGRPPVPILIREGDGVAAPFLRAFATPAELHVAIDNYIMESL